MKYVTTYDIGERKRKKDGINEDSIAVTVLEDGHRNGLEDVGQSVSEVYKESEEREPPSVHGPGDTPLPEDDEDQADKADTEADEASVEVNEETTQIFAKKDASTTPVQVDSVAPRNRHAAIVVLADGAGGEQAGDIASYIATTVITEELSGTVHRARRLELGGFGLEIDRDAFGEAPSEEEIEEAIADAVEAANRAIVRYANETGLGGTYSTVVVGVFLGDKFHYGWVGDSRAYVINEAHEQISLLTKDHAKVQRYEDSGQIDEIEAHVHPDGNEINRAIGGRAGTDPESVESGVETRTIPLFREDIVVVTSDGLIDAQTDARELYQKYVTSGRDEEVGNHVLEEVVTDRDIRNIVLEEPTLTDAAERFVSFANEKGGKDNISLILFSGSELPPSPDPERSLLPERALDPDTELEDRNTVIKNS